MTKTYTKRWTDIPLSKKLFVACLVSLVVSNRQVDAAGTRAFPSFMTETRIAQRIEGVVTGEDGSPIPGVNVIVKGTSTGTISDPNGKFVIEVPNEATVLIFSFIGLESQEVTVGKQSQLTVVMKEDKNNLQEVVVVGYGVQKKKDLTGALASVPMKFVKDQPVRNVNDVLQGRVAGVTLSKASGQVGSETKIRIRGANSILGNNAPLYVVDGIIGGEIGSVHDIESVEVLKDASATAIYGERASNGVILVTTKKATSSVPQVRVSLNTGFSNMRSKYPDKMNAGEYARHLNDMVPGTYTDAQVAEFDRTGGVNWIEAITQTGVKNDHNITYSQKVNKVGVYLSARYTDEKGTMINSKSGGDYQIRANIDFKPLEKLSFNFDIRANKMKRVNGTMSTGTEKADPLFQSLLWSPTEPIWADEGNRQYHRTDRYGALALNPFMQVNEQQFLARSQGIYSSLIGNYKITDWLTYNVTGFVSQTNNSEANYTNAWINQNDPQATRNTSDVFNWRLINRFDFNKSFNDVHNLAATLVYESEANEGWSLNGLGRLMPLPDLAQYYNIGLSNLQSASSGYFQGTRIGYLGRVNYNFKSKYLFTASYRIDAQSGPTDRIEANKYGAFPSFGVAWNVTEEDFIGDRVFTNLKLRLGWGMTGNPTGFPYTRMSGRNHAFGSGVQTIGYAPGIPANPLLRWEETVQTNVGVDFAILRGRLSGTIDYFNKDTRGLLTRKELPMYYGYGRDASFTQNLGNISNKGVELTLDFVAIERKNFSWNTNFNNSIIRNKIISLGEQDAFLTGGTIAGFSDSELYRVQAGLPLGTMWGYDYMGVWKSSEEAEAAKYGERPGDPRYRDLNNDGVIDLNNDAMKIGDSNPKFIWGMSNSISYKRFNINFLIQGMHGQKVLNLARAAMSQVHPESRTILLKEPATRYWTPENENTEWPNLHSTSNRKRFNSSQWIEDGSWVKLKSVALTYTLPKSYVKFANVNLQLSATELLTLTKYKGFDPEVSSSGTSDLFGGIDAGTFPIPRTVLFGLILDF